MPAMPARPPSDRTERGADKYMLLNDGSGMCSSGMAAGGGAEAALRLAPGGERLRRGSAGIAKVLRVPTCGEKGAMKHTGDVQPKAHGKARWRPFACSREKG